MLKFFLRLLVHLGLFVFILLPLQILGLILIPIGIYLGEYPYLHPALKWYDNADIYINRDSTTYLSYIKQGFWYRYYWLAIRNPLNYFGYTVLGVITEPELYAYTGNSNFSVGDSEGHIPGWLYTETEEGAYEYYWIYKWNQDHCFRFRMGWKVGLPVSNPLGSWIQYVFVVQLYKSYSGE